MRDGFYPFIGSPDDYILPQNNELPLFREFAWDFKINDFVIDNNTNDLVVLTGNKAIEVWIYKTLMTDRFEHLIYSWDYGTSLINLVGQKFSRGYTESEAFRYVREALLINPYIVDVINNGVRFEMDDLRITVKVETVYGEVSVDVRR